MASPTPAFKCANGYLGWGEPCRGLWFVGLETADPCGPDLTQADVINWHAQLGHAEVEPCNDQVDLKAFERQGASIRQYTSKIANRLSRDPTSRWEEYPRHGVSLRCEPIGLPTSFWVCWARGSHSWLFPSPTADTYQ